MGKSTSSPQGIIDVLEDPASIRRKIGRAVTDSGSEIRADEEAKPGVTNLLRIYSALTGETVPALEQRYAGAGYGALKKDLAEVVVGAFAPIRERTEKMLADEVQLDRLLAHGAARAREVAGADHGHRQGPGRLSAGRVGRRGRRATGPVSRPFRNSHTKSTGNKVAQRIASLACLATAIGGSRPGRTASAIA